MVNIETICFIGHRKITVTQELQSDLYQVLLSLVCQGAAVFLFGDHSVFDSLCYQTVSELKKRFPYIKRIKYRRDYPVISEECRKYFIVGFEDNICPPGVERAGRSAYVQRNQAMIRNSDLCIFYYNPQYIPSVRSKIGEIPKSGTAVAYDYAKAQHKEILNMWKSA